MGEEEEERVVVEQMEARWVGGRSPFTVLVWRVPRSIITQHWKPTTTAATSRKLTYEEEKKVNSTIRDRIKREVKDSVVRGGGRISKWPVKRVRGRVIQLWEEQEEEREGVTLLLPPWRYIVVNADGNLWTRSSNESLIHPHCHH